MIAWFAELFRWRELIVYLALTDIRQKYRRSALGAWWNVITLSLTMGALGFIWSNIFRTELRTYLPYFAVGYVLWTFTAALINEGAYTFIHAEPLIRQCNLPLQVHVVRVILRNLVILGFNSAVVAAILILMGTPVTMPGLLGALLGLVLSVALATPVVLILGIFCARYRDLPQVVANITQLLFFITPIMWRRDVLPSQHQWIADWNPLVLVIDSVRKPILGEGFSVTALVYMALIMLTAALLAGWTFISHKKELPYWA